MSDFGCKEWLTFLPIFSAYIILALYVLFTTNVLAGYFYLGYLIFIYMGMNLWIFCTRCPHYGQSCSYILAGLLTEKLLAKKEQKCTLLERAFPVAAFIVLLVFPLIFVLGRPIYLLSFLGLIVLLAIVKPFILCAACKNTNCPGKTISQRIKKEKQDQVKLSRG